MSKVPRPCRLKASSTISCSVWAADSSRPLPVLHDLNLKEVPPLQIASQQQQQHLRASAGPLEALVGAAAVQIGPVLYSACADGGRILLGRWAPVHVHML